MDTRVFSTDWGNPQVPTDAKNDVNIMTGKNKIEGNMQGAMNLQRVR
jgi:hypothetical protein